MSQELLFQDLKRLAPVFSRAATPMNSGSYALVVDMGDGTFIKAFRPALHSDVGQLQMEHEIDALSVFDGRIGDFYTPRLVEAPVFYSDKESPFCGYIRISKLDGLTADWNVFQNHANVCRVKAHFEQVGRLIAAVHEAGDRRGLHFKYALTDTGRNIYPPGNMRPEILDVLRNCNEFYFRNIAAGFAHTDIVGRNVIADKTCRKITGVIDFALSGIHANPLIDFCDVPDAYVPDALRAYNRASGKDVDIAMIKLTKISCRVFEMNKYWNVRGYEAAYAEQEREIEFAVHDVAQDLAFL